MDTSQISRMSSKDKVMEAVRRSRRYLPGDMASELESVLSPTSLAIMATTMVAWAVSQAFGVGEVADIVLLGTGLGLCGWGAIDGFRDLFRSASTAMRAHSDSDLDRAAQYFASGLTKVGFQLVMAILFHRQLDSFRAKVARMQSFGYRINYRPNLAVVDPPPPPDTPAVRFGDPGSGNAGVTDYYGNITIDDTLSPAEKRMTLDHEMVHRFFSPKAALLRQFRVRLGASGYERVLLLRYLEEAMAETYAQMRAYGIKGIPEGVTFPVKNGYMVIVNRLGEVEATFSSQTTGAFIGVISVGGQAMHVFFTVCPPQANSQRQVPAAVAAH